MQKSRGILIKRDRRNRWISVIREFCFKRLLYERPSLPVREQVEWWFRFCFFESNGRETNLCVPNHCVYTLTLTVLSVHFIKN